MSNTTDESSYDKVDPAALLLAVLAVATQSIGGEGAWGPVSTVIALVVGIIVFCFTWPHSPQRFKRVDRWILTAQSLAYGLIVTVAAAWPAQSFLADSDCRWIQRGDCVNTLLEQSHDVYGTFIAFVVGAVVAVISWFLLKNATERRLVGTGT